MAFDPNQIDLKLVKELYSSKKCFYTRPKPDEFKFKPQKAKLSQEELQQFLHRMDTTNKLHDSAN